MGSEVSADTGEMLAYYTAGSEQTDAWAAMLPDLRTALSALASAMADVPEAYRLLPTEDLAGRFEGLIDEQVHQDTFVYNVARDVLIADGFGHVLTGDLPVDRDPQTLWPSGVSTVPESQIDPGPASLAETWRGDGTEDAERLVALLDERMAEGSTALVNDPELVALLTSIGGRMDDGSPLEVAHYFTAFYETLGPQGTLWLAGVLNDSARDEYFSPADYVDDGEMVDPFGSWTREIAEPLIDGFAAATWHLDPEMLEELTTLHDEQTVAEAQADLLAVLLTGDGDRYAPGFLADAADAIFLDAHNTIGPAQALALRALAENPDAARQFTTGEDGQTSPEHMAMLLVTDPDAFDNLTPTWGGAEAHTWLGPQESWAELYELWQFAAFAHATGLDVTYHDDHGQPLDEGWGWRDWTSLGVDFIPIVGDVKAGSEVVLGVDPVTGEEVNRWVAGISFAVGLIPGIGDALGRFVKWVGRGFKRVPGQKGIQVRQEALDAAGDIPVTTGPRTYPDDAALPTRRIYSHDGAVRDLDRTMAGNGIHYDLGNPPKPGSPDFDRLIDLYGDDLIYVVRQDGTMAFAPRAADGTILSHGALRGVDPDGGVVAAGEVRIFRDADGNYVASGLSNQSGHFEPPRSTLGIAGEQLESLGISWDGSYGALW
jgi:hypothetical protein